MSIKDIIAKNLLYYRKKAGLTQKQFADMLNVKNTSVSNWENGINSIDIDTLFLATKILNVSINNMFGVSTSEFSDKEIELIHAYRKNVDMQPAVDRILNIEVSGDEKL